MAGKLRLKGTSSGYVELSAPDSGPNVSINTGLLAYKDSANGTIQGLTTADVSESGDLLYYTDDKVDSVISSTFPHFVDSVGGDARIDADADLNLTAIDDIWLTAADDMRIRATTGRVFTQSTQETWIEADEAIEISALTQGTSTGIKLWVDYDNITEPVMELYAESDQGYFKFNGGPVLTGVIDDDTMSTASASTLATSESIKAYADTFVSLTGDETISGYKTFSDSVTVEKDVRIEKQPDDTNGITWDLNATNFGSIKMDGSENMLFDVDKSTASFIFGSGASEYFRIDNTGNVGIGSISPARNLTIGGDTAATTHLQITNATSGTTTGDGFQISQYTSGAVQLWNRENNYIAVGTNNTERMRVDASGNVAIGTTSSTFRINVASAASTVGNFSSSTSETNIRLTNSGGLATIGSSGNAMKFTTSLTERMRIDATGNVGIGTDAPSSLAKLDVVGGGIRVYNGTSTTTGFIENRSGTTDFRTVFGDGDLTFSTGASSAGTERMRIDASGTVGINTTTASVYEKLVVDGGVQVGSVRSQHINYEATPTWTKIFHRDFSSSSFAYGQHNIQVLCSGATNGKGGAALIHVNTKQQGTGDFYDVQYVSCSGYYTIPVAYKYDPTGGANSQGSLEVWAMSPVSYMEMSVGSDRVGLYALDISGAIMATSTGSGTQPSGSTLIDPTLRLTTGGNAGIGTDNPTEVLEVSGGSLLVDAFNAGNEEGIFFRRGFTSSNKYNMSILAYDHNNSGVSPDGLSINSSEAISFCGGSNTRNELMRITADGKVGIGITNPSAKLHVDMDDDDTATYFHGGGVRGLLLYDTTTGGNNGDQTNFHKGSGTGSYNFSNLNVPSLLYLGDDGKVRIGTETAAPNPDALLHIHKNVNAGNVPFGDEASQVISTNANAAGVQGYLGSLFFGSQDVGSATQYAWRAAGIAGYMDVDIGTGGAKGQLLFYTANSTQTPTERMRIDEDGNVGIGMSTPDEKLVVSGNLGFAYNNAISAYTIGKSADQYGLLYNSGVTSDTTKIAHTFTSSANSNIMTMTYGGLVGIGETSPTEFLHISGAAPAVRLDNSSGTTDWLMQNVSDSMRWVSVPSAGGSSSERMRLDANGNLGIGVTSVNSVNYNTVDIRDTVGGQIILGRPSNIDFFIYSSSTKSTIGSGVGQDLSFNTNSTGANNERMRIDAAGVLLHGKTVSGVSQLGTELRATAGVYSSIATSNNTYHVYNTSSPGFTFYVSNTGTINAVNTTISALSDERLKENVRDLDDGLSKIMQLQPRKFDWKEGKGRNILDDRGFIAQEFETVFPDMVQSDGLNTDSDGESYKTVCANLVPTLVKSIQEQQAIIEALEIRIQQLENN